MAKDIKFFADKERQINEYCAKVRRDEMRLVVNNARSDIDWELYE